MNNKQVLLTLLVVLMLALVVSYYMTKSVIAPTASQQVATTTTQKGTTMTATTTRPMPKPDAAVAAEYIIKNISTLSPVKPATGETFRVSGMRISTATGTVEYLVGKKAYSANFTYTVDATGKVTISPFVMKK